ncbi:MAG: hypothetical protein H6737_23290, partial [Alphaproteobacteria bacterium]|nr:hypothetical protein [Alphaproteobacteria bacterium]
MSLVARVARTDPDLVRLAQEVCLATRVDPALLRNARLALGLPVEIEARLWFSPLVQTRSPAGFVLAPHVLPELRRALGRSDGLDAAWRRVQEMHAHLPDAVRLEEELAYHAVADASEERLEQVLAPAAAALRDPSRKGVDLWARRALSRLPERAQSVPAAREIAKELDLLDADVPPDPNGGDWTRRVTLLDGQQGLNMRLVGDTLQLGAIEDTTGAVVVMGATSEPNLVEVRYGGRSRIVAVQSSTLRELRGVTPPVTIRFADGAGYALVDRAQLVQELLDAVAERGTSLEELEALLRAAGSLAEPAPVDSGVIWEAFRRYQSIHGLEGDLDGALTRLREDGSTGSAILILYSEDTLAWADYLRSEFTRAGHRVRIATPRDAAASEDGMLQAGERLLGIVSPALVLDEAARALLLPPDVAVDILEMPNVFLGGMAGRPSYAEIPNRRNAALRPPADADTLVRALAELELFIEPVGPTPPLPPF